jgi:hypothetical protein
MVLSRREFTQTTVMRPLNSPRHLALALSLLVLPLMAVETDWEKSLQAPPPAGLIGPVRIVPAQNLLLRQPH